jgi:hypothetical protein
MHVSLSYRAIASGKATSELRGGSAFCHPTGVDVGSQSCTSACHVVGPTWPTFLRRSYPTHEVCGVYTSVSAQMVKWYSSRR